MNYAELGRARLQRAVERHKARLNYTELGGSTLQSDEERHKVRLNYTELGGSTLQSDEERLNYTDVHWHPRVRGRTSCVALSIIQAQIMLSWID
jgi:hypothetical protein